MAYGTWLWVGISAGVRAWNMRGEGQCEWWERGRRSRRRNWEGGLRASLGFEGGFGGGVPN
ncbi:hypothetical protein B1218_35815, partial [Pseudomonas ogarae]